jgi:hypothetical protein
MRQGGDPRLPLELALVKVTRPAADLSRETLSHRLELLEQQRPPVQAIGVPLEAAPVAAPPEPRPDAPPLALEQLQEAWSRTVLPVVEERGGIPTASLLREARPTALDDDTLTLEFPSSASFHRKTAEEPKHTTVLRDALYEVTGRKLAVAFAEGEHGEAEVEADDGPTSEEELFELMKETFDAREVQD